MDIGFFRIPPTKLLTVILCEHHRKTAGTGKTKFLRFMASNGVWYIDDGFMSLISVKFVRFGVKIFQSAYLWRAAMQMREESAGSQKKRKKSKAIWDLNRQHVSHLSNTSPPQALKWAYN